MGATWWISESDLDRDQAVAIQGMPENASFLLRGPAGSGKTNILALRAGWLRIKGKSHLKFVVFTRALRDFVREGCEKYGVPAESVVTSHQFLRELLAENGVTADTSGDFEADRDLLAGKAQALISEGKIGQSYDALLVDECQDYSDTELAVFRSLTPRLILATDNRQSIYKTAQTENLLDKLVNGKVIELKYHYRSGLKVCRVADGILRGSGNFPPVAADCQYPEEKRPSSVEMESFQNIESQYRAIIKRLPAQLDAYPGDLIGVLFPKRDQYSGFVDALSRESLGEEAGRIRVDTMHSGKGLEFRAVHLGGCEALYKMGATQKRLIYTAIMRGRTSVHIYFSGSVPGYLESAIEQLLPPKADPAIGELFKSKK